VVPTLAVIGRRLPVAVAVAVAITVSSSLLAGPFILRRGGAVVVLDVRALPQSIFVQRRWRGLPHPHVEVRVDGRVPFHPPALTRGQPLRDVVQTGLEEFEHLSGVGEKAAGPPGEPV